ncbi:MAG: hypothetical protein ACXABY_00885 [Candidatus Thorarchaeota archaeon]|jgi:hypothetical protein
MRRTSLFFEALDAIQENVAVQDAVGLLLEARGYRTHHFSWEFPFEMRVTFFKKGASVQARRTLLAFIKSISNDLYKVKKDTSDELFVAFVDEHILMAVADGFKTSKRRSPSTFHIKKIVLGISEGSSRRHYFSWEKPKGDVPHHGHPQARADRWRPSIQDMVDYTDNVERFYNAVKTLTGLRQAKRIATHVVLAYNQSAPELRQFTGDVDALADALWAHSVEMNESMSNARSHTFSWEYNYGVELRFSKKPTQAQRVALITRATQHQSAIIKEDNPVRRKMVIAFRYGSDQLNFVNALKRAKDSDPDKLTIVPIPNALRRAAINIVSVNTVHIDESRSHYFSWEPEHAQQERNRRGMKYRVVVHAIWRSSVVTLTTQLKRLAEMQGGEWVQGNDPVPTHYHYLFADKRHANRFVRVAVSFSGVELVVKKYPGFGVITVPGRNLGEEAKLLKVQFLSSKNDMGYKTITISINGKQYVYEIQGDLDWTVRAFKTILFKSPGKAVVWIKKKGRLEETDYRGFNASSVRAWYKLSSGEITAVGTHLDAVRDKGFPNFEAMYRKGYVRLGYNFVQSEMQVSFSKKLSRQKLTDILFDYLVFLRDKGSPGVRLKGRYHVVAEKSTPGRRQDIGFVGSDAVPSYPDADPDKLYSDYTYFDRAITLGESALNEIFDGITRSWVHLRTGKVKAATGGHARTFSDFPKAFKAGWVRAGVNLFNKQAAFESDRRLSDQQVKDLLFDMLTGLGISTRNAYEVIVSVASYSASEGPDIEWLMKGHGDRTLYIDLTPGMNEGSERTHLFSWEKKHRRQPTHQREYHITTQVQIDLKDMNAYSLLIGPIRRIAQSHDSQGAPNTRSWSALRDSGPGLEYFFSRVSDATSFARDINRLPGVVRTETSRVEESMFMGLLRQKLEEDNWGYEGRGRFWIVEGKVHRLTDPGEIHVNWLWNRAMDRTVLSHRFFRVMDRYRDPNKPNQWNQSIKDDDRPETEEIEEDLFKLAMREGYVRGIAKKQGVNWSLFMMARNKPSKQKSLDYAMDVSEAFGYPLRLLSEVVLDVPSGASSTRYGRVDLFEGSGRTHFFSWEKKPAAHVFIAYNVHKLRRVELRDLIRAFKLTNIKKFPWGIAKNGDRGLRYDAKDVSTAEEFCDAARLLAGVNAAHPITRGHLQRNEITALEEVP